MTHYSHNVSRRLLIKQKAHVLFCEFRTAPLSMDLPLWMGKCHLFQKIASVAFVRQLVGTWAKQRLGPFIGAHLHTASHGAQLPGGCPINRVLQEPTVTCSPSPPSLQTRSVAGSLYSSFFFPPYHFRVCIKTPVFHITRKVTSVEPEEINPIIKCCI